MIHTTKTIKIPYDITQSRKPVDSVLENLEHEMSTILNNKALATDVKLSKYNNILRQYNKIMQKRQQPYEILIEGEKMNSYSDEAILQGIPHNQANSAKLLLHHVHPAFPVLVILLKS